MNFETEIIRYARLPVSYDLAPLQQEVARLASGWKPHFNERHYNGEWTVLPLRSPGGSEDTIVPDLMMNNTSYEDTPLMELCPSAKKLTDQFRCEILSARLLNLKKGAVIKAHVDAELAFERGEARLHFPVFTNDQVEFYVEDDRVIMQEGECWYINAKRKHRVANLGDTDRIHLVIDMKVNDWLTELFARSEKSMVPELEVMKHWGDYIKSMRGFNDEAMSALADAMEAELIAAQQRAGTHHD